MTGGARGPARTGTGRGEAAASTLVPSRGRARDTEGRAQIEDAGTGGEIGMLMKLLGLAAFLAAAPACLATPAQAQRHEPVVRYLTVVEYLQAQLDQAEHERDLFRVQRLHYQLRRIKKGWWVPHAVLQAEAEEWKFGHHWASQFVEAERQYKAKLEHRRQMAALREKIRRGEEARKRSAAAQRELDRKCYFQAKGMGRNAKWSLCWIEHCNPLRELGELTRSGARKLETALWVKADDLTSITATEYPHLPASWFNITCDPGR